MVILIDRRHKNVHHQFIPIIHGHDFILHTQSTFNPADIDDYTLLETYHPPNHRDYF